MSIETRHTEKNILFQLLKTNSFEELQDVITNLMATMEPEDVELVQKRIAELKERKNK